MDQIGVDLFDQARDVPRLSNDARTGRARGLPDVASSIGGIRQHAGGGVSDVDVPSALQLVLAERSDNSGDPGVYGLSNVKDPQAVSRLGRAAVP